MHNYHVPGIQSKFILHSRIWTHELGAFVWKQNPIKEKKGNVSFKKVDDFTIQHLLNRALSEPLNE